MLTKEEYLYCYGNIRDAMKKICLSCQEEERCKGCDIFNDLHNFRKIIHEHFELLEVLKDCGFGGLTPKDLKVVIEAGQYSSKKLNELKNPQPYKFEELKKGMWVWDNKGLYCFKCNPAISKNGTRCVTYSHFWINCGDEEDEFFEEYDEFEEGRFFPLTKAMEYYE